MGRHQAFRQQAAQMEHLLRLDTQPVLTELPPLPGRPTAGEGSSGAAAPQGQGPPPQPAAQPPASSAAKKQGPPVSKGPQSTVQAKRGVRAAAAPKASLAGVPGTTKTVTRRIKK